MTQDDPLQAMIARLSDNEEIDKAALRAQMDEMMRSLPDAEETPNNNPQGETK